MKFCWFLILCTQILFACTPSTDAQEQSTAKLDNVTVFQNVYVISMEQDQIGPPQNVVIANGTIHSISTSENFPVGAEIVDGSGKYLMPGLAEMHAHIPTEDAGDLVQETLFLYLAGGVTTIRGMLGHPSHLTLRSAVTEGTILGPNLYTSGPSINGNSAPDIITVTNMVRAQKEAGYDFLKLHPGLKRDVFDALTTTAKEVGITYAGHVSRDVGIRHALASGYASVDHLDGYVEGLVPTSVGVDPQTNGFFGINFTDLADESLLDELILSTLANKVWVVPTQCLAERWSGPVAASELASAKEMGYMPKQTVARWEQTKNQMQANEAYDAERAQRFIDLRRRMIKAMFDNGVGVLLGSDAPQVFNVPGFAIQHEIEMYVAAGLSPYEAILTGTVNPAKYFGTDDHRGMVKEGYQADLLLIDENPLEDISRLRHKSGVMIKGKWISQADIASRLVDLAKKYASE